MFQTFKIMLSFILIVLQGIPPDEREEDEDDEESFDNNGDQEDETPDSREPEITGESYFHSDHCVISDMLFYQDYKNSFLLVSAVKVT